MESRRYLTDLSEKEWGLLEPFFPASKWRGPPILHSPRQIPNAVFYALKTGCQWRMLPREFPPWKTVLHHFRAWRLDGTWNRLNRVMRERLRAQRALSLEVEIVNRSPKPTPDKVLRMWAREWFKEGHETDLSKLPTRPGFENLPGRRIAERTFA
jgi:transposase